MEANKLAGAMLALALAGAPGAASVAAPQARAEASSPGELAIRMLDLLDAGDYARVAALFDDKMRAALPAEKLQAVWESLPAQVGPATGRGTPELQQQQGLALVIVPLHYARAEWLARIAVDKDGKVAGFLIQPAQSATPAPPVAADATYQEREMRVGSGERALGATLAMPKGKGPVPGVVLVHGSGPHDRDETIGPNKPFLDLARGLAAQGIAVLRYDKRSQARPQDYADDKVTIDSETTDDAVAAVAALRAVPGIDRHRVFVFGHSQGAMMAPRITTRARADGMILLAAPARDVLDILVEQTQRRAVLDDGKTSAEEAQALTRLKAQVAAVRAGGDVRKEDSPLGQSAAYWRSVVAVDPVKEAVKTTVPILILQGARDIQVVDADWQRWRTSFDGDRKATLKLYERLNHLGIAGDGAGSPAEYNIPGHVDPQLIDDVAAWIKAQ